MTKTSPKKRWAGHKGWVIIGSFQLRKAHEERGQLQSDSWTSREKGKDDARRKEETSAGCLSFSFAGRISNRRGGKSRQHNKNHATSTADCRTSNQVRVSSKGSSDSSSAGGVQIVSREGVKILRGLIGLVCLVLPRRRRSDYEKPTPPKGKERKPLKKGRKVLRGRKHT